MATTTLPGEPWNSLAAILHVIREGLAATRPDIERTTGLGRSIVTERVADLNARGIIREDTLSASTGGRRARIMRINESYGHILVAELGTSTLHAGIADPSGKILAAHAEGMDISHGPDAVLARLEDVFQKLLADRKDVVPVRGIGIGIPGPVEFATSKPVLPPLMPGWDGYDVRGRLESHFGVPAWLDNDVNLMALGELRGGEARDVQDFVYVKIGTGVGAGLVSGGRLQRGAQGTAGDIGHMSVDKRSTIVCRCGRLGCLEAIAGGVGIVRDATAAAERNESPVLRSFQTTEGELTLDDVLRAATVGDATSVEILTQAGAVIGRLVANLVSLLNPSLILIGGRLTAGGEPLMTALRRAVHEWGLPLATRDLRIVQSPSKSDIGLRGAAFLVLDNIFSAAHFASEAVAVSE